MSEGERDKRGLNILCIDGGGTRGLSSLLILSEVMKRLQGLEGIDQPLKPMDYFDVIAGAGTGGVSACLLGRLHLSVDQAIKAYFELANSVFSDRKIISIGGGAYKSTKLRDALKSMVQSVTGSEHERMKEENVKLQQCKTMVFAMSKYNMNASIPVKFRSYATATNTSPDCTIWEALYATMAHPDLFKAIDIFDGPIRQTFVGGELGCSNPIAHVLDETRKLYPGRHVSCVLSIGAGHARTIHNPDPSLTSRMLRIEEVMAMKNMATDSERVAEEMAARFQDTTGVYYRFNLDQGMQNIGAREWERLSEVAAHTRAYIRRSDTNRGINRAARATKEREEAISVAYLDGRIQLTAANQVIAIKRCPAPTSVYIERKDQIRQVSTCITGGIDERRVCVVHGLGGAGKTQLALKTIELNRDSWKHVLYVDASSREAIEITLQDTAQFEHIGTTHNDTLNWLEFCHEPWLVVFDGADHPSLNIRDYFPGGDHGSILITTRLHDLVLLARGPGSDCHVPEMNHNDALSLLLKLMDIQTRLISEDEMAAAQALLEDLGHLPLAIVQAGAYIRSAHMPISQYQNTFLAVRQKVLEHYSRPDGYRTAVYTTWIMCYDLLQEGGNPQRMLWLIAFLHYDGITEEIFKRAAVNLNSYSPVLPLTEAEAEARDYLRDYLRGFIDSNGAWDPLLFSDTINELAAYSLIEFSRINFTYSIHELVQAWARTILPQSRDLALECSTTLVAQSVGQDDTAESHIFRRRLELHVNKVLSEQRGMVSANHGSRFAEVYSATEQWSRKEVLEIHVKETSAQILGDEHPDTLASMENLALTYSRQGRWNEAEPLQAQILTSRKRILGEEHPDTLTSMSNLAHIYLGQGRPSEAEVLQTQALESQKRILGEEHPQSLNSMSNLARVFMHQDQWDKAEEMSVQVLTVQRRCLGDEHPHTLSSMVNLASTLSQQGRWDGAESLEMQVLSTRKRTLGDEHPDTLNSMINLAYTYSQQGKWDKAEELEGLVLNRRRQRLGDQHPDTLNSMNKLARTYSSQGRWSEAERLQAEVLDAQKKIFGDNHPGTLTAMNNLALTYSELAQWDAAERLQRQTRDKLKAMFGEKHLDTLTAENNLARTYIKQGRWNDAEPLQRNVTDWFKRLLGGAHPDTLTSGSSLTRIYSNLGLWDKAIASQTQMLEETQQTFGRTHPKTLKVMAGLAYIYSLQQLFTDAGRIWLEIVSVTKQSLGDESLYTLVATRHLATTYQLQGNLLEAESQLLTSLNMSRRVLGNVHSDTLAIMNNLSEIYKKMIIQASPTYFEHSVQIAGGPSTSEVCIGSVPLEDFTLLAETSLDIARLTPSLPAGDKVTISSSMPLEEVIQHLTSHKCPNVTALIDEKSCDGTHRCGGTFGDIYRGSLKNEARVALKCIRMLPQRTGRTHQYAAYELYVWSKLKHDNILELLGLALFRNRIAMVSPWMDNGSLPDYLQSNPTADRCELCTQVANGLAYMHDTNVVHGDLKSSNVFISEDGVAKIGDFGSALKNDASIQLSTKAALDATLRWTAPELLTEDEYQPTTKSDVYALGMTILEVISGKVPYHDRQDVSILQIVTVKKEKPARPEESVPAHSECGDQLWNLLLETWCYCSDERPKARDVWNKIRHITRESLCPEVHEN